MKGLIILITALLFLGVPAQALMDNFYFTIPPEDSSCFAIRLPVDLNTLRRGYYTLETDSDFPVNLGYVKTFAEAVNTVRVPICFYSGGRQEGDFAYYTIKAGTLDFSREYQGGICVSETSDRESREPEEGQNPCDLINGYEDLFYIAFLEPIQWALPGSRINYTLLVQSMKPLDLDIDFSSDLQIIPQNARVQISKTERTKSVSLEVMAPNFGEHEIKARARVKLGDIYCDIPFCEMEANATLISGSITRSGFDIFVFPQFLSSDFAESIHYTIFIENRDNERGFDVRVALPEGLESDWTQKVVSVKKGERRELSLNITPIIQEPDDYTITFSVSSGGIEKTQEAYLSVMEIESDILRRWGTIKGNLSQDRREKIDFEVDKFLAGYRKEGLDLEKYKNIDKLLRDAQNETTWAGPETVKPQALDPLLMVIPAIAIIAALIFIFYKKSRSMEETEI